MSAASFSRAKRRRIADLQEEVNLVVETDRRFFERHPLRTHRLRLASRAEVAILGEVHGLVETRLPPGERWFCVIRQLDAETQTQTRLFTPNDEDCETDLSEQDCAWIFNRIAGRNSNVAQAERAIMSAVEERRGAQ